MRELRGAVAVLTGAASGIGRALAIDLAGRGAQLALADVNSAGLEETRKLLGDAVARTYVVDVARADSVEDFARQVQKDFGRASLLVNNAGVALLGTFDQTTLEEMEWLIRINLWGVIYGCKFFLPLLHREPDAHIVNISSIFGLVGPPGQTAYSTSKYAVRGFSESLREEFRVNGAPIKVTTVHPAGIATSIADQARAGRGTTAQEQRLAKEYFKKVALITPKEAAHTIIKGVLAGKKRVMIGADAYRVDILQRVFPSRASSMFADQLLKRRGIEQPESVANATKAT